MTWGCCVRSSPDTQKSIIRTEQLWATLASKEVENDPSVFISLSQLVQIEKRASRWFNAEYTDCIESLSLHYQDWPIQLSSHEIHLAAGEKIHNTTSIQKVSIHNPHSLYQSMFNEPLLKLALRNYKQLTISRQWMKHMIQSVGYYNWI